MTDLEREAQLRHNAEATRWFAGICKDVLDSNTQKGDWFDARVDRLLMRLKQEVLELEFAIKGRLPQGAIIREAADVSNFSMMLAEHALEGRIDYEPHSAS